MLGHVVHMDKYTLALKIFDIVPAAAIRRIIPPLRWKDQVEMDLPALGTLVHISNYKRINGALLLTLP